MTSQRIQEQAAKVKQYVAAAFGSWECVPGVYLCQAEPEGDEFENTLSDGDAETEVVRYFGYYMHTDDGQFMGDNLTDQEICDLWGESLEEYEQEENERC